MQKPVTAGTAGTAFRFPTIGPEILPVLLGAGEELYPGKMGWVQDCSGLPEQEVEPPSSPPFCPDFTLSSPALCNLLHKN